MARVIRGYAPEPLINFKRNRHTERSEVSLVEGKGRKGISSLFPYSLLPYSFPFPSKKFPLRKPLHPKDVKSQTPPSG